MKLEFDIKGAADLDRILVELPRSVSNRLGGNAVRAGARVIAAEQKLRVPVKTGELKRAIGIRSFKSKDRNVRAAGAGVYGKEGPLAHIVEFGGSPHAILPKSGTVLKFNIGGKEVFTKAVKHPGTAPHPFLRPAADTKAAEAINKIGENLGAGIEREAAKLSRK